ncbi:MAG: zinc ribbon domain-containing protein [Candidatus Liptonbacteria bacterium]|nr:zinc ribbon domain-containing protein [Candidatus Liptonbacteria bacterium]
MDSETQVCPTCHQPVTAEWYFCPNCGKNLKEKPLSITWFTQTWLYLLSIFLPPLGLWPGMKYLRSHNAPTRRVGFIVVVLTILSLIISIWLFATWFNRAVQQANNALNGFGNFQ